MYSNFDYNKTHPQFFSRSVLDYYHFARLLEIRKKLLRE